MNKAITYSCHGFNDNLPKGKASGELTVYESSIECKIATSSYSIPLTGLVISMGGASDRLVFLAHPSLPGWRFYTSDRSILNNTFLRRHESLKQPLRKARSVRLLNWTLLATVTLTIILLPLFFFTKADKISKIVARQIPLEWEQQLGKAAYEQFMLSAQPMDEQVTNDLLRPMTTHLEQALVNNSYDFTFTVVNNEELNAFALPGGYIVIHSGLILTAESAEELLGVLAHEIAHVIEQHGIRNMVASAGTFAVMAALLGDLSGISGAIATVAPLLINQSYSRDFEREADEIGYQLLVDANINPQGLTQFFDKILEKEKLAFAHIEDENVRDTVVNSTTFLSSHPTTEERIKRLQNMKSNNEKNFRDLSAEFDQLQSAVKQFTAINTSGEIQNGSGN